MNNTILFIRVIWAAVVSLVVGDAVGQSVINHQLNVTYNKTSSLVFASTIAHVDLGSRDVLAERTKGIDNVLKVKAARKAKFPETNVTVITADGTLHSFKVNYVDELDNPIVGINPIPGDGQFPPLVYFSKQLTSASMEEAAKEMLAERPFMKATDKSMRMQLSLKGIFISDKTMFYRLELKNSSQIRYDIANLRWFIKDKKQFRRTAIQEVQIHPLFKYGLDTAVCKGGETKEMVFAFDKFTIPDAKKLIIEVMEEKGGRHLSLAIKNKSIIRARPLTLH